MIARSVPPLTLRGILDRVGLAPRQRIFSALGDWASNFARRSEMLMRDGPERFYRFCHDCHDDTPHDGYDELGIGWYAQVSRCRHCGRQGTRVWSLV
jgi:hypothetical protein